MIIDSSALIAILREEPESTRLIQAMARATERLKMSTANYLEAAIVIDSNDSVPLSERLEAVLAYWEVEFVPVSADHARRAREAYGRFGKGRHAAKLNFGDCFAYALAAAMGEALLYKGEDFGKTDIRAAA